MAAARRTERGLTLIELLWPCPSHGSLSPCGGVPPTPHRRRPSPRRPLAATIPPLYDTSSIQREYLPAGVQPRATRRGHCQFSAECSKGAFTTSLSARSAAPARVESDHTAQESALDPRLLREEAERDRKPSGGSGDQRNLQEPYVE